jgi:hypothetical protein
MSLIELSLNDFVTIDQFDAIYTDNRARFQYHKAAGTLSDLNLSMNSDRSSIGLAATSSHLLVR